MIETLDIQTAAKLLGVTERHARRMCMKGKLVGATYRSGKWTIPVTAHVKFREASAPEKIDLSDIPDAKRDEALRRLAMVQDAIRFADTAKDINKADAIKAFAATVNVAWQTLYRWIGAWKKEGLSGLVDRRGQTEIGFAITQDAWDFFCSLYLDDHRPSAKTCYINTQFYAQQNKLDWRLPKLATMYKYIDDRIPLPIQILHREGAAAYEAKCAPHILIDQNSVEPGSVWVGDHHQFDCWIRHRGDWVRPWITGWEDYRSRKIVGWYISTAPNSTTILQAMRRGIEQYGPPESVKIDNGKDYDAQMFTGQTKKQRKGVLSSDDCQTITGLYAMMNIGVSFAIPYNAKGKKIERWFATVCSQFTKSIPTYCGRNTLERSEAVFDYMKTDKAIAEAYTLESFTAAIEKYIAIYNASSHAGEGMNRQSPDEVFSQRTSRRMIDKQILDMLMRVWSPELTVGKNGVKFKGFWYGQYDTLLHQYFGRKVRVAYNPDDLRELCVHDAKTLKLITLVRQAELMPYGAVSEESLREAMAQKSRAVRIVKQARPAARVAAMSLTDLTLSAMAENTRPAAEDAVQNVKPVRTPLDGQAKEYLRQRNQLAVRKAAGAEGITHITDLQFDFSGPAKIETADLQFEFDSPQHKPADLRIFGDDQ